MSRRELCCSESFFDEFLQFPYPRGLLLGRGGAQREGAGVLGARGGSGQALAEQIQHAALLAPLQALQERRREKQSGWTPSIWEQACTGTAAGKPVSNHSLSFTQELCDLWVILRPLSPAPGAKAALSTLRELKNRLSQSTEDTLALECSAHSQIPLYFYKKTSPTILKQH